MGLSAAGEPVGLSGTEEKAPSERPARRPIMGRMRRLLHQFWRDLTYQVSALPASILAFTVVVCVLSLAASAIGIIVGLPFLLALFAVLRWNARLERKRTG